MNKVSFTQAALKRIANIQSIRFTEQETVEFQVQLLEGIRSRLSYISPLAGYREHLKGPWANTHRILVSGFKVYYVYNESENAIIVKGIKAPRMK
jgi:hypothetical protein